VDSWAGFIKERDLLLDAFHSVPNVILLSGDRHEFAVIKFTGENDHSYPVHEISTSPLSMFHIPFIRTLSMESPQKAIRMASKTIVSESGADVVELLQEIPKEKVLKYLPKGNHKWYVRDSRLLG
jgi:alkaline phosphatase D